MTFDAAVRLTVFMTDLGHLDQFRAVRDEFVITTNPPASSLVEVSGLVRPEWLIEVKAITAAR